MNEKPEGPMGTVTTFYKSKRALRAGGERGRVRAIDFLAFSERESRFIGAFLGGKNWQIIGVEFCGEKTMWLDHAVSCVRRDSEKVDHLGG